MGIDKKILLNNLDYYMKKNSIKASELEETAGVSKGYVSRLKKTENRSVPGIEFLLAASSMFGITVEALCLVDYSICTENEEYYVAFFNSLITKTIKKDILWKRNSLKQLISKIDSKSEEELIVEEEPSAIAIISQSFSGKRNYCSSFEYGEYKYIDTEGDFYSLVIDEEHTLYMVKVKLLYQEEYYTGIEMFMASEHKKSNVCCISPQTPQIYDDLFVKLYNIVKDSININCMDQETQKVIDKFLM